MRLIHLIICFISICIGILFYHKGEVEIGSYLTCVIAGFMMPKTFPIINDNHDLLKWRQFIELSASMEKGPDMYYEDVYIKSEYNNNDNKKEQLIRIYNSNKNKDILIERPLKNVLIFYFPGAWIFGSIEHVDTICRYFALYTNFIVVSVQYSLAPEFPFPHGFNDAYNALQWVYKNIQSYGGNPNMIYLSGESAGGNLAAAVTARNADISHVSIENRIPLKGLLLIYPPLACEFNTTSYLIYRNFNPMLSTSQMEHACNIYKGNQLINDSDYTYQPLYTPAHILQEFPPTIFIIAKYDVLRDDSLIFANLLIEFEIEVDIMMYNNTIHGFFGRSFSSFGLKALQDVSYKLIQLNQSND